MEIRYSEDKKVLEKATDISGDFIIPDGVERIRYYAFSSCHGLTSITIPSSVARIGESAFSYCNSLTSISIPSNVTSIGESAFSGCSGLTSINVEVGNAVYDSREGCNAIIETFSNKLIAGCNKTVIPYSVTSIEESAFSGCSGLTSIGISSNVICIGDGAFSGCGGLTSIIVEKGNSVYDSREGCNAIIVTAWNELIVGCKNTVIPSSVESIGDFAFYGCKGLTSITIPSSVTSIGKRAFWGCSGLTSIKIFGDLEDIGEDAFWGCKECTLYVPSGMKSKYKNHPEFSMFKNIVEIEAENESDNTYYDNPTSDIYPVESVGSTQQNSTPQYQYSYNGNAYLPNGTILKGSYRIIRFIAAGGFGCTYEAEHIMLGKRVAIKEFFIADFCNRDARTGHVSIGVELKKELVAKLKNKFIDEARAIAQMSHSNIISVSDVFEENGTAYYVMDYIEGKSLAQIVYQNGPLQERVALQIIKPVLLALKYVHSRNRLHLDIKPANIMVKRDGSVFLIDFGVSKQYDEVSGQNTSTLMGYSSGYAPVEQMSNRIKTFTPATDIYALGATFYTLLTGIIPLDSTDRADYDTLQPLPHSVSANTRKAIEKAMNVSRNGRIQSVDEFLSILG